MIFGWILLHRYWLNLSRIEEPGGNALDSVRANYYPSAESRREQIKEENAKEAMDWRWLVIVLVVIIGFGGGIVILRKRC